MILKPEALAAALVDVSGQLPPDQLSAICDLALQLLKKEHPATSPRSFLQIVQRTARRRKMSVSAALITPSGQAGEKTVGEIAHIIESALGTAVTLEQQAHSSLKGGVVLCVGDERFENSIPSSLAYLKECFTLLSSSLSV